MGKLTAKAVEKAAPRDKEYKLHDGEGLFLRVRSSGAKSWLFSYSLPGDKRLVRMTIGTPKDLSLKDARDKIRELQKLVKEQQKLNTLTYGLRVPILGLFPNIVSCQNNKSKDITVKDMSLIQDLSDGKFS